MLLVKIYRNDNLENGKVEITSISTEHDTGTESCTTDKYSPSFVGNGTYQVSGNVIKVYINNDLAYAQRT